MDTDRYIYDPKAHRRFSQMTKPDIDGFNNKAEALEQIQNSISQLKEMQEVLYAQDQYAVLIIFQAMDAAGKDGTIKHVMSGVNPQGCDITSFKVPSPEELDHDFMWRCIKRLPERGKIGIFNRSYYEEVIVTRVHPKLIEYQRLPNAPKDVKNNQKFWDTRFKDINNFEKYLTNNGTVIIKFFLNISKAEQKRRLIDRIEDPDKNWKFSIKDVEDRAYWKDFMDAYEDTLVNTSTNYAPWYVIPADNKWFMRTLVINIIVENIKKLNIKYPKATPAQLEDIKRATKLFKIEEEKEKEKEKEKNQQN
ncbi:MAG: polyphosphate kinase 2 family protein [Bacteroidales bacterium]